MKKRKDGLLDCEELGSCLKAVFPEHFSSETEQFFQKVSSDGLEINKTDIESIFNRFTENLKGSYLKAEDLEKRYIIIKSLK